MSKVDERPSISVDMKNARKSDAIKHLQMVEKLLEMDPDKSRYKLKIDVYMTNADKVMEG